MPQCEFLDWAMCECHAIWNERNWKLSRGCLLSYLKHVDKQSTLEQWNMWIYHKIRHYACFIGILTSFDIFCFGQQSFKTLLLLKPLIIKNKF